MQFVANYEVRSESSVVSDDLVLRISHPEGRYRVRIKNIPREDFRSPFVLSLHLYFEAESLQIAEDAAEALLADVVSMLSLVTGSAFHRHRIRQIVDATPGSPMKEILMWGDAVEHDDPQSHLNEDLIGTVEKLLRFDLPAPVHRAMRWYRLGIRAQVPDDQFMNFWFAVEILAEFHKPSEKVPDKCPKCQAPLYCESCKSHPTHRPYAKQAINALFRTLDKDCDDATIERLQMTRNSLMHGMTLREIEDKLPEPREAIVDVLGRLLWRALLAQFPNGTFDGSLQVGYPSTYVHRRLRAMAHIKTIVPNDADGDLDLSFKGTTVSIPAPGPPQSATPTILEMTLAQYELLRGLARNDEICKKICRQVRRAGDDRIQARVLATDMAAVRKAIETDEANEWRDVVRKILSALKPAS